MTERIFLIGYRGTGKSTTARLLAARLGWSSCDADEVFETRFGKSIRQVFQEDGEAGFRTMEATVLDELAGRAHCVIATGGGVVLRSENRERLKSGTVVWLTATPEAIWQRLQQDATTAERRPNLRQGGLVEIQEVLQHRQPLYEAIAEAAVDTTQRTPPQVCEVIVGWLQSQGWPL